MHLIFRHFILITGFLMLWQSLAIAQQQTIIGWLETVAVNDAGFMINAKIDTGADNSSINTIDQSVYKLEGKPWVRFSLKNEKGQEMTLEKPVLKTVRIKEKNAIAVRRIVVGMDICLDRIKKHVNVNLVDRSNFKYQVLIGRTFLEPDFLVDASKKYLTKPRCK